MLPAGWALNHLHDPQTTIETISCVYTTSDKSNENQQTALLQNHYLWCEVHLG